MNKSVTALPSRTLEPATLDKCLTLKVPVETVICGKLLFQLSFTVISHHVNSLISNQQGKHSYNKLKKLVKSSSQSNVCVCVCQGRNLHRQQRWSWLLIRVSFWSIGTADLQLSTEMTKKQEGSLLTPSAKNHVLKVL